MLSGMKTRTRHRRSTIAISDELLRGRRKSNSPATGRQSLGIGNRALSRRIEAGLPGELRLKLEEMSGVSLRGVRVHPNSPEPERHDAHSLTQGADVHLGPGREQDLAHEAWHVAQQRQGRVAATGVSAGQPLNHDAALEAEADRMGAAAATRSTPGGPVSVAMAATVTGPSPVQFKCRICNAKSHNENNCPKNPNKKEEEKGGGRGLTRASKGQISLFHKILPLLDRESMYDEGAKSLVGGRKGKPNGLSDSSVRIDRQMTGNVQFQIGDDSYGKVTFSPDAKPGAIIAALIDSVNTGEERVVA